MREILFKGKKADNGKWEVGCLIILPNGDCEIGNRCINPPDGDPIWEKSIITHKVDPSTICQYTGLTDKNGNKIYENSLVKDIHGNIYKVFWREKYYLYACVCVKATNNLFLDAKWDLWSLIQNTSLEVIGNTFDNPELLREE